MANVNTAQQNIALEDVKAHKTIDRVAQGAHTAVDKAASAAVAGEDKLHQIADDMSAQASAIAQQAKARSEQVTAAVSTYAKENPIKTVGFAFLAGAVVASLLNRK
jgi:ElaB/YqjD/DUF883 family membrane-anchored ribosome-binding protein